jgi:hypothetical protein
MAHEFEVEALHPEAQESAKTVLQVEAAQDSAFDQLVDLYCELRSVIDPKLEALKIEQKELTEVETQLMAAIDEQHQPEDESIRKTQQWLLSFGPKGKQFQLEDKKKLIELLGLGTFIELAEVSVTHIRKYLTESQVAQVGKDVRKTKRKLSYAKKG